MWLYTSYAAQPHRSVASKNGDFRYHGPKYNVLEVTSGIALASPLTTAPSLHMGCARSGSPRERRRGLVSALLRLNRGLIRSIAQGEPVPAGFPDLTQHPGRGARTSLSTPARAVAQR